MRKVSRLLIATIMLIGFVGCTPHHEHDFQEKFDGSNYYLECECGERDEELHKHNFQMKFDDSYHYLECECGERDEELHKHNYGWINGDDPALARRECTECHRVYDYEQIFEKPILIQSANLGSGSEPSLPPIMSYQISSDKGHYSIGEEFEITLNLNLNHRGLLDGPFHVKLAKSPYYEIVGKDEYIIEDFRVSDYRGTENSLVDFKFKVRATASSSIPRPFEFKIKCNANEDKMSYYQIDTNNLLKVHGYYDPYDEYCITICDLSFMITSEEVVLGKNNLGFSFDNFNRQYVTEKLSKANYVARFFELITADTPRITCFDSNNDYNRDHISYVSKNIRVRFYLTDSFEALCQKYEQNSTATDKEIALELIEILFSKNIITKSQYECEKAYILNSAVGRSELRGDIQTYQELIPFSVSEYDVWLIYDEQKTVEKYNII